MKTNNMKRSIIMLTIPVLAFFSCHSPAATKEAPAQDTLTATPANPFPATASSRELTDSLQAKLPVSIETLPELLGSNNPAPKPATLDAAWIDAYLLKDSLLVATMTYNGGQPCVHRFLVILNRYTLKAADNRKIESNCEGQTEESGPVLSYGFVNDSTFYTEADKRDTLVISANGKIRD